ncbi:hypothetical protein RRG08_066576, partial [Elysia crispata]
FDEYFLNLTPENNTRNPWFREFWSDIFNCSLDGDPPGMEPCSGNESLSEWPGYKQEGLVQFVIDSVYAMGHAAHDMLTYHCQESISDCPDVLQRLTGAEFLEFIRNVSFTGEFSSGWGRSQTVWLAPRLRWWPTRSIESLLALTRHWAATSARWLQTLGLENVMKLARPLLLVQELGARGSGTRIRLGPGARGSGTRIRLGPGTYGEEERVN